MNALSRTALMFAAMTFVASATAEEPKAPPAAERFMIWARRYVNNHDNALHTEVTLNGKSLGMFHSATQRDISGQLKLGTNTIVFATTAQEPASFDNYLEFQIGVVTTNPKTKMSVMKPVLIRYRNSVDWRLNDDTGKYTHPFGPNPKTPDQKTVTHTYTFEYTGVAADLAETKEGDFVLQAHSYLEHNASMMASVSVNGKSFGTFLGGQRALNISKVLKKGENEIRLTSEALANQLFDNDTTFEIIGPLSYDVAKEKFVGKSVVQFKAMEGFTRDSKSAQLHVKGSPGKTTHERVIRFMMD